MRTQKSSLKSPSLSRRKEPISLSFFLFARAAFVYSGGIQVVNPLSALLAFAKIPSTGDSVAIPQHFY